MFVRCPECHHPIELDQNGSLAEVGCGTCGHRFALVESEAQTLSEGTQTRGDQFEVAEVAGRYHAGQKIAHFKLIEPVGMGGQGDVWKAHDIQLDRLVAIKFPRRDIQDGKQAERFIREARAAAQLSHPNIVAVHEVGTRDQDLFIVSDFVDGITLADKLENGAIPVQDVARLGIRIAEALNHAHHHGVIHRDLTPRNIMLRNAEPCIMDFGLAKRAGEGQTVTARGIVIGTPAYMSPEQARGESWRSDARSDIYSLGVLLYEMLVGEAPFRGSADMMIYQILHDDPIPPRKLKLTIPLDLETICLKCMAKDPQRRYPSAREVMEELQRYQDGRPIEARPVTVLDRVMRWARRNRKEAALAAVVAILLLVLGFGGFALAVRQTALADENRQMAMSQADARRDAESQSQLLARQREQLRRELEISEARLLAAESRAIGSKMPLHALQLASSAAEMTEEILPVVHETLLASVADVGGQPISFQKSAIFSSLVTSDGRWLINGRQDGAIERYDLHTGSLPIQPSVTHAHRGRVWHMAASFDGSRVVSTGDDGSVRLWQHRASGLHPMLAPLLHHEEAVHRVAMSEDGRRFVTASRDRRVLLWEVDWETGDVETFEFVGDHRPIEQVGISGNGTWLAQATVTGLFLGRVDATTPIGDSVTGIRLSKVVAPVRIMLFSPDSQSFYAGDASGTVYRWKLDDNLAEQCPEAFPCHDAAVVAAELSSDGRWFVSAAADNTVCIRDLHSGSRNRRDYPVTIRDAEPHAIDISEDGRLIAFAGMDRRLWILTNPLADRSLDHHNEASAIEPDIRLQYAMGHDTGVHLVAIDEELNRVLSVSEDVARLWPTPDVAGSLSMHLMTHRDIVKDAVYSRDGRWLATAGLDGNVLLWERRGPGIVGPPYFLKRGGEAVRELAFCPHSRFLVAAAFDPQMMRWDLHSGDPAGSATPLTGHLRTPRAIQITHDGRFLVSAGIDRTILRWDLKAEDPSMTVHKIGEHLGDILALAVSPDGQWGISGDDQGNLVRWSLQPQSDDPTGETIYAGGSAVRDVRFAPDANFFLIAGDDGQVQVWDSQASGIPSLRLSGFPGKIYATAISPDGRWLVAVGLHADVALWDLRADDVAATLIRLKGHRRAVFSAAFTPDSRYLVTGSNDRTARIWPLEEPDPGLNSIRLGAHQEYVQTVAISPDQRFLATGSHDSSVRIWDLQLQPLQQRARGLTGAPPADGNVFVASEAINATPRGTESKRP